MVILFYERQGNLTGLYPKFPFVTKKWTGTDCTCPNKLATFHLRSPKGLGETNGSLIRLVKAR